MRDWAVLVLASAFGAALLVVTAAILWAATHNGQPGLAVTQADVELLMAWGGGIIGVLGAYIGFRAGEKDRHDHYADREETGP